MLRILLLPILLCFCLPVYGQKIRFTDTSNVWYYTISDQGAFKRTAAYGEDTVMNGHQYRKLEGFWIREDTSARKVYGARSNGNEQILYDYTLAINDTLYCSGYTYPKLWVTGIDSLLINGTYHRVWYMQPSSGYYPRVIIEGIGGKHHPLQYMWSYDYSSASTDVNCFRTNGQYPVLPNKGPDIIWEHNCHTVSVPGTPQSLTGIRVVPNPSTGSGQLLLPYTVGEGAVSYHQVNGALAGREYFRQRQALSLPAALAPGLYFYTVTDLGTQESASGKFLRVE